MFGCALCYHNVDDNDILKLLNVSINFVVGLNITFIILQK
jgi:hypothetical protein